MRDLQLGHQRDRLDLIIDSVADPILATDLSGNIVLMNTPAERLFTVRDGVSAEQAQRVSANDALFSSFASNLFFTGDVMRRHGDLSLVDPQTGRALPMEAVSGKIVSDPAR